VTFSFFKSAASVWNP